LEGPMAEDPRARERFLRETRAVASIDHPGVLPIYDAGEAGSALYTIMRFVDGPDLRKYLKENGRQSLESVRQLGSQVAAALGAAHSRGIVHRDVKPANILLASFDVSGIHSYLCDFGLAKRLESGPSLTKMDEIVGTVDYIAPEQIESGTVDARTDMYSLGCVVYEMLVGHPPFRGSSDIAVLWSHLRDDPPSVRTERPELPRELDELLRSAMAKSPADRPSGSAEFVRGLVAGGPSETRDPGSVSEAVAGSVSEDGGRSLGTVLRTRPPKGPDEPPGGDTHDRRRRLWLIGAAAVGVLAVVGVVVGLTVGGGSPSKMHMTTTSSTTMMDAMSFTGKTTNVLTSGEKTLKAALDPDMQTSGQCKGETFSQGDWTGVVGALSCTWPHRPIPVTYIQFQNDSTMEGHFDELSEAHSSNNTNCATAPGFAAVQLQSGPNPIKRFPLNNDPSRPAAPSNLLCFRSLGKPEIIWTNTNFHVLAEASAGPGVTSALLLDFYGQNAGPYSTG